MKDERVYYVVMSVQVPTVIGGDHARINDPVGFLPVFSTEEAAKAYAGDRFTISQARLRESKP
jgi:hypothetical protein